MFTRFKLFLAMLAVLVGLGAASATPALAHYGDWATQQAVTQRSAQAQCDRELDPSPYYECGWVSYASSNVYGEHSREFRWYWHYTYNGVYYRCTADSYKVGHSYDVFGLASVCS